MSVSQRPRVESTFDDAVARLEKSGRQYLRRHRLPPEDADDILQQTLLIFLIKHDEIYNPEAWVRGALEEAVPVLLAPRQKSLLTLVDSSILDALSSRCVPIRPNRTTCSAISAARSTPSRRAAGSC